MKTTFFQLLFILSFTVLTNNIGIAQDLPKSSTAVPIALPAPKKTILDSVPNIETPQVQKDSISTDSIAKPKGVLEGIVDYKAKDYTYRQVREIRFPPIAL